MLKYITLPPVTAYKRRWVRRIMIIVTFPQELVRVTYYTFVGAAFWWRQP
jgi:hypothetical protein